MHMGLKLLVWGTLLGLLVADLMEEAAAKAAAEAAARPVDNSVCDALEGQYTGELQQVTPGSGSRHHAQACVSLAISP